MKKILGILLVILIIVAVGFWLLTNNDSTPETQNNSTSEAVVPTQLSAEESAESIDRILGQPGFEGTFQEQINGLDAIESGSQEYDQYVQDLTSRCVSERSLDCANSLIAYAEANADQALLANAFATRGNVYAALGDTESALNDYTTAAEVGPADEEGAINAS